MLSTKRRNVAALATVATGAFGAACAATLLYTCWARPRMLNWGCEREEGCGPMPGDAHAMGAAPIAGATQAITIHAPAADVWPWLAQMGRRRGGFYSFTRLENLIGCRTRNARCILPQHELLEVGDHVRFHPKLPPMTVEAIDLGRSLTLASPRGRWTFDLRPLAPDVTRLVTRYVPTARPGLLSTLFRCGLLEPAHVVMQRQMLRTMKRLAEDHVSSARRERTPTPRSV